MRFDKKAITQWVAHRCERQLGLSLWSDREQAADEAAAAAGQAALGIPHRQIRPGLEQMARAGTEWQAEKVGDLLTAFGPSAVIGQPSPTVEMNGPGDYRSAEFSAGDLAALLPTAQAGTFIIEAEFNPINPVFEAQWRLGWRQTIPLEWSRVRPDIIQVGRSGQFSTGLAADGRTMVLTGDARVPLRVVDAKLSSEPGPGYFAEVTYYSLALAAWLEHSGLSSGYVVAADAALWPGSFEVSRVRRAHAAGFSGVALAPHLDEDLELVPTEVFVSEITRFFHEVLERVARNAASPGWQTTLAWHVVPSCSGCDYLGQAFPNVSNPGRHSQAHANHCVPMALANDHLSRLPFLPRGGTTVLGRMGVAGTNHLANRQPSDACFDEHHSLRAGREIIPARAQTLGGVGVIGIPAADATTASIPRWSDLSLFVTADFDPTSAITLAFGLSGVQFGAGAGGAPLRIAPAVYMVQRRDVLAERQELSVFLQAIRDHLVRAQQFDADATVQLYLWDSLTFDHLTRVIGRHLDWLLASGRIAHLAWLFPPEELVANPRTAKTPAISVVGDAVRAIVATDQAHTYTLLGTAAVYNEGGNFNTAWLRTPPYWTTEFSDQIPGERAFDIWTRRNTPRLPFAALVRSLDQTVQARHRALSTVVRRLRDDLKGALRRHAPKIRDLTPPALTTGSSLLGSLLVTHTRLNAATSWQENARLRAMSPNEREARFASIRCTRRLLGAELTQALATLGLVPAHHRIAFEISPGSAEADADVGGFLWAISPEGATGLLDQSLYTAVRDNNLENEAWWQNKPPWVRAFENGLQVTIRGFDRHDRLVAVDLQNVDIVAGLSAAGLVDLRGPCIIDPISHDYLARKVEAAAKAIRNPPKAHASAAAIREAFGVTTRGPNKTATNPPEDYLWDPVPLEASVVARDTAALRPQLEALYRSSNEPEPDAHQWAAWEHALTRRLTLIWGPPGTGKSRTLGAVLDALALDATHRSHRLRVLVTAQTYTAVDNVVAPFAARAGVRVPTFRIRSAAAPAAWAEGTPADVNTDDLAEMSRLTTALASDGPVVVGSTPQQAQKVINAVAGSAGAPVFNFIVIDLCRLGNYADTRATDGLKA